MVVKVNGDNKHVSPDGTLYDLISFLNLADKVMAAAVNMKVVKKTEWSRYILKPDDKVELLDFVGGG